MKRRNALIIAAVAASLLGATSGPSSPSTLLDEADNAFARGDYALAEQLYSRAEERAPDPGRVTIGLATAKYRLALEEPVRAAALLAGAEGLYLCCSDADDPRRAEALVGLGNCLFREAVNHDAAAAWSAAERFAEADRVPGAPARDGTARHNLQCARLLARQIPTAPLENRGKLPDEDPEHDRKSPDNSSQQQDLADNPDGMKSGTRVAKADPGQPPSSDDESHAPGKGELPPVPDHDGQPPLTLPAAREHLEQASRRIMEESRQHRRGAARSAGPGVPDW